MAMSFDLDVTSLPHDYNKIELSVFPQSPLHDTAKPTLGMMLFYLSNEIHNGYESLHQILNI